MKELNLRPWTVRKPLHAVVFTAVACHGDLLIQASANQSETEGIFGVPVGNLFNWRPSVMVSTIALMERTKQI